LDVRTIRPQNDLNINEQEKDFREFIIKAATKAIPMTTGNVSDRFTPWWSEKIANAIRKRKNALNRFRANRFKQDYENYMTFSRQSRNLIRIAKKDSWQKFISSINTDNTSILYKKLRV
jgi:hypothetical protein